MEVIAIDDIDREKALELFHRYKTHLHHGAEIDHEIAAAYKALSKGQLVIKALESIAGAGLDDEGLPRLALCRADGEQCRAQMHDGRFTLADERRAWPRRSNEAPGWRFYIACPEATWKTRDALAAVPHIPLDMRPRRGLANYHILWEADWHAVPKDPYLLRRIGARSDLWLVTAMWDLTEVERAALASRITLN